MKNQDAIDIKRLIANHAKSDTATDESIGGMLSSFDTLTLVDIAVSLERIANSMEVRR